VTRPVWFRFGIAGRSTFSLRSPPGLQVLASRRRRRPSVFLASGGRSAAHSDERCGCRSRTGTGWRPSCRTPAWCSRCRTRPAARGQCCARSPPRSRETACSTRRRPAASWAGSTRPARSGCAAPSSSPSPEPSPASNPTSNVSRFRGSSCGYVWCDVLRGECDVELDRRWSDDNSIRAIEIRLKNGTLSSCLSRSLKVT